MSGYPITSRGLEVDWGILTIMSTVDTAEVRVHPRNFQRVILDAQERGAKVSRGADGRYWIDEMPVILDSGLDVGDTYAVAYGGGKLWD